MKLTEIYNCEFCIALFVKKLMDLEHANVKIDWEEFEDSELLFLLGEKVTEENLVHIKAAREQL